MIKCQEICLERFHRGGKLQKTWAEIVKAVPGSWTNATKDGMLCWRGFVRFTKHRKTDMKMIMTLFFSFSFQLSKSIVDKAFQVGINFFDTAEVSRRFVCLYVEVYVWICVI